MEATDVSSAARPDRITYIRDLQSEERVRRNKIMAGVLSAYFGLSRDKTLEAEMDELIDSFVLAQEAAEPDRATPLGRLGEGRALVVIGESGSGKTRSLQRLFSRRQEFARSASGDVDSILTSVSAPSPCTLRLLGQSVLTALGYDTQRQLKENVVWELVRRHLQLRGTHFLHIDEFQHLVQTRNPIEIQKVRDTLKGLMQTPGWPIWLILSGLPEIADVVEGDTQIRRRCRFVQFEDFNLERDAKLVRRVVGYYGTDKASLILSGVVEDEFISRLLHAALGQFGILIEYVQDAIKQAVAATSCTLEVKHFASAYAARTGCNSEQNVFTVTTDWTLLDVRAALYPLNCKTPEEKKRPKPRDQRSK